MELRHLRYFITVAEEGSLTVAAERRLHTAQPSLSRQIRDLEVEVGAELMTRSARGIELTAAGRAFLDHARLALAQVEAAASAARRAAHPEQRTLALGFLSGCEPEWLPAVMHLLRPEERMPDLAFKLLAKEPLIAVLRSDHRLAALEAMSPQDLVGRRS
jgi:LysR family transcriptional regulator, hca operon transcriptional activator